GRSRSYRLLSDKEVNSRRTGRESGGVAGNGGDQSRPIRCWLRAAGATDKTASAVERARHEFAPEQTILFERARQPQRARLFRRKGEAAVIGRVADQEDCTMAKPPCFPQRMTHQPRADTAIAPLVRDCEGAEQQGRPVRTGHDVP